MNFELVDLAFSEEQLNTQVTLEVAIGFLWKHDLINVGELAEMAIARVGEHIREGRNAVGCDFADGSDSKYVTVGSYYGSQAAWNKQYYATVGGLKNKTGILRVMAYEPMTQKNYFFKIPYEAYEWLSKQDSKRNIKIRFNEDGTPKRPRWPAYDYWQHECTKDEWVS